MKQRIRHLLSVLLVCAMVLSLLPVSVFATGGSGSGLTADDPMVVPENALIIKSGTYYGISKDWFQTQNPNKADMYFSIAIPESVTIIASDAFRDSWSNDKQSNGAVTANDGLGGYSVVAIDFSDATSLTTIKSQAAMGCSNLSGVLDLSNTKVETIGKNAFKECTGLTGVILPKTLKSIGSDDAGSVFYGCTSLEYVRAVDGAPNAVFELPKTLKYLGNQSFYKCTGLPVGTTKRSLHR